MEDLISRETMKDLIDITTWYHQNRNKDMVEGASDEETAWFKAKDVFKAIENVPSALALEQERKKGKWIVNISEYTSVCSLCGADEDEFIHGTEMWYGIGKSKFCPNCGAEMKGEEE